MTACSALDKDALRSLLTTVRDTVWSWEEADVPALAGRFGWDDIELLPDLGAVVDPGYGIGSPAIRLSFDKGRVDRITMRISSKVEEGDDAGQLFLADVFSDAVAVGSGVLGETTSRRIGALPEVRWRGTETTIVLKALSMSVVVTWSTNAFQDHWDSLS